MSISLATYNHYKKISYRRETARCSVLFRRKYYSSRRKGAAFRPIEVSHNNTSKVQSRHTDVYTIILYFITRHMLVSQGTKFAFCSVFLVVTDISATVRGTDRGEILHDGT